MAQQPPLTPEQFAALEPDKVLRTMRIIAGALMMGVISFSGVVAMNFAGNPPGPLPANNPPPPDLMLTYIGIGFTIVVILLRFIIPRIVVRGMVAGIKRLATTGESTGAKEVFGRLLMVAQTKMILEFALLEGACFFNLIAVMQSHSGISVGVVVVLMVLMALNFPTLDKLLNWLEQQNQYLITD
ncbi:MAG: hypothetical protein ACKVT0_01665 [Planctomycetaceae bacterium]